MPRVLDDTGALVERDVADIERDRGFARQLKFDPGSHYYVRGPDGMFSVPGTDVEDAIGDGYSLVQDEEGRQREAETAAEKTLAGTSMPTFGALSAGALSNLPGAQTAITTGIGAVQGDEAEADAKARLEALKVAHPWAYNIGGLGGFVGALGLAAPLKGAAALSGLEGAAATAGRAATWFPRTVVGAGEAASGLAARAGGGALLQTGARLATEGAVFGAGQAVPDAVEQLLTEDDATVKDVGERVGATVLHDALTTVALGGALHGIGAGVGAAGRRLGGRVSRAALAASADAALGAEGVGKEIAPHIGAFAEEYGLTHEQAVAVDAAGKRARLLSPVEGVEEVARIAEAAKYSPKAEKLTFELQNINSQQVDYADRLHAAAEKFTTEAERLKDEVTGGGELKAAAIDRLVPAEGSVERVKASLGFLDSAARQAQAIVASPNMTREAPTASAVLGAVNEYRTKLLSAVPDEIKPLLTEGGLPDVHPNWTPGEAAMNRELHGQQLAALHDELLAARGRGVDALVEPVERDMNRAAFTTIDQFKGNLGKLIDWETEHGSVGMAELKKAYGAGAKAFLENEDVWGKMGAAQTAANGPVSRFITAHTQFLKDFGKPATEGPGLGRMLDRTKFQTFVGSVKKMSSDASAHNLVEMTRAAHDVERAMVEHYGASPSGVKEAVREFVGTVKEARERVEVANTVKEVLTKANSSSNFLRRFVPGAKVGGLLGGFAGGAPGFAAGAAIGAMAEASVNPSRALTYRAYVQNIARELDGRAGGAIQRAVTGWVKSKSPIAREAAGRGVRSPTPVADALERTGQKLTSQDTTSRISALGRGALRQRYVGAANLVLRAHTQRDEAETAMTDEIGDAAASSPKTTAAAVDTMQRATDFLYAKLPSAAPPGPFEKSGQVDDGVTKAQADEFLRYVEATLDPVSVIDDLAAGTVSREGAEALRKVYPSIFEKVQSEITSQLTTATEPVPYQARVQLGILFDLPTDRTLTPEFVSRMQGAYLSDDQPDQDDQGIGPGRGAPRPAPQKIAQQATTPAQRIASGTQGM